MKKAIIIILVLAAALSLCACGAKEESPAPEIPVYEGEPIINIEVLDVGFCRESVFGYTQNETSSSYGATYKNTVSYYMLDYTAEEGDILFVIQANISNISDGSINIEKDLVGSVDFKGKALSRLTPYAFQNLSSVKYNTLRRDESTPIIFACFLTEDYAKGFKGCTVSVGGVQLSYDKEEIETKTRIAFDAPENEETVLGEAPASSGYGYPSQFIPDRVGNTFSDFSNAVDIGPSNNLVAAGAKLGDTQSNGFSLWIKLHNSSSADMPAVEIPYQLLDENGDALDSGHIFAYDLESDSSEWVSVYISDHSYADIHGIRLIEYRVANSYTMDGGGKALIGLYTADFTEDVVFTKKDIIEE